MIPHNINPEYEQARNEELDRILSERTKTYGQVYLKDSVRSTGRIQEQPSILEGYIESFGEWFFKSYFDAFDLYQLECLHEARFINTKAGYVDFYFKHGVTITESMKDMTILATSAGMIKIRANFKWVDRY